MIVTISKTGQINGRGSMPYKWVSGLTKNERETVRRQSQRIHLRAYSKNGKILTWGKNENGEWGNMYRNPTDREKQLLSDPDECVLIDDRPSQHYTQSGWKQVIYAHGRYNHREASPEQIALTDKTCG